jgi:hypothetical protein
MKLVVRIVNTIAIVLSLLYIFFTHDYYKIIIDISGNATYRIYSYSNLPYTLLWVALVFSIIIKVVIFLKNKKKNIIVIFPSDIIVVLILLVSIILTPRFEFIEYYDGDNMYPEGIRYDNLFIRNEFYSNEGDFEGGYGDTKYIYLPISKKIILFTPEGTETHKVKYKNKEVVMIDNKEYKIEQTWFTES